MTTLAKKLSGFFGLPVLVGLVARLAYLVAAPQRAAAESDDGFYWSTAQALARGEGFAFHGEPATDWMPGFPLFLSLPIRIFGPSLTAARLTLILLSVATIVLVERLVRKWFDDRTARGTAWVFALFPPFWFYSCAILSETLAIFLCVLLLWLAARQSEKFTQAGALTMGLVWGAAIYTKPEMIFLGPGYALLALLRPRQLPRRAAAAMLVIGALMLSQWTLRNWRLFGEVIPLKASSGFTLWLSSHHPPIVHADPKDPELAAAVRDFTVPGKPGKTSKNFSDDAMRRIKAHPHLYAADCVTDRTRRLFLGSQTETSEPLADSFGHYREQHAYARVLVKIALFLLSSGICLLGILGLWTQRKNERLAAARFHFLANAAAYVFVIGVNRYSMVLMPMLIPHALVVLEDVRARLRRRRDHREAAADG